MKAFWALMQKEWLLLRNSYFRTIPQVISTILLLLLVLGVTAGVCWGVVIWLNSSIEIPFSEMSPVLLQPLFILIYSLLGMLVFFSTIDDSKEKLFLTPDLSILIATPVKPGTIFNVRFLWFILFNPFHIIKLFIFGLAPLAAIGILLKAPWYYYPLILLVTYFYLIIPAAMGVILIMLLLRIFSPRRMFQVAGAFSLLIGFTWFFLLIGDRGVILEYLYNFFLETRLVWEITRPLLAPMELGIHLLGYETRYITSLLFLIVGCVVVYAVAVMVMQRVYYYNYQQLQTADFPQVTSSSNRGELFSLERSNKLLSYKNIIFSKLIRLFGISRVVGLLSLSSISILVKNYWKMALRNLAMGVWGTPIFMGGYLVIISQLVEGGAPIIALINSVVVVFLVNALVDFLFMSYSMAEDQTILNRQYWQLKTLPLEGWVVTCSTFFTKLVPALPLSLLFWYLASYVTEVSGGLMIASLLFMLLVLLSSTALDQLTNLLIAGNHVREVTLITRLIQGFAPVLYLAVIWLPLGVGFYYHQLEILSFMHSFAGHWVMIFAVLFTLLITLATLWKSLQRMVIEWESLEIM